MHWHDPTQNIGKTSALKIHGHHLLAVIYVWSLRDDVINNSPADERIFEINFGVGIPMFL